MVIPRRRYCRQCGFVVPILLFFVIFLNLPTYLSSFGPLPLPHQRLAQSPPRWTSSTSQLYQQQKEKPQQQTKQSPLSSPSKTTQQQQPQPQHQDTAATAEDNPLLEGLKGAAIQVGNDLFAALRWGAANALTKNLPNEQRTELLKRMDVVLPQNGTNITDGRQEDMEDSSRRQNSVNEAVAEALARESQRSQKKWEREKNDILLQAETAANLRVQSDLAIQKLRYEQEQQQLQESLKLEKKRLEKETKRRQKELEYQTQERQRQLERIKAEQEKAFENKLHEQAQRLQEEMIKWERMQDANIPISENGTSWYPVGGRYNSNDTTTVHPVLGRCIVDLGYKRIHLVTPDKLAAIPVWKKQRIYRHNRAKAMANDKLKTLHLGLPGIVCLHEEDNGKLSILDGQHRVGMLKIIQEKQQAMAATADTKNKTGSNMWDWDKGVLVEVYPQTPQIRSTDHAQDIFLEINKAEPIKLVDMPGVATAKDRKLISQAVNTLEDQYSNMFSPSQRCRTPNVNVDNLRDNLFAANIIKRHNLTTKKQLVDWVLRQNLELKTKYVTDQTLRQSLNAKAWEKASDNEFYLGLESSWLYK